MKTTPLHNAHKQINRDTRRGRFMTLLGNAKSGERYYETGGFLLSSEEYRPPFLLEKDGASLQSCISQQSHLSAPVASRLSQFKS
jgi:hypothetical protein